MDMTWLPFVIVFLILFLSSRRNCPACGTPLPMLVSPWTKTKRQWLEGGWVCPACGIDVDWRGRKVESSHKARWTTALLWIAFPAVLTGTLAFQLWMVLESRPQPPVLQVFQPAVPPPALQPPAHKQPVPIAAPGRRAV